MEFFELKRNKLIDLKHRATEYGIKMFKKNSVNRMIF